VKIDINEIHTSVLPMETRFPFQYGIASMTTLPHLILRTTLEIDGKTTATGIATEGLPPKWFTKNPATTFEKQDLPEMLSVIRKASEIAIDLPASASFFEFSRALQGAQAAWAPQAGHPPLLAQLGTSLVERAVLDALCRSFGKPLHTLVRGDALGIDLGRLHPELARSRCADFLPARSAESVIARHTVGLGDPLDDSDLTPENRVEDGLPYTLVENIRAYGLTHFKIKLCGNLERDTERLRRLTSLLDAHAPAAYRFTLDGNEQYQSLAEFRAHWEAHRADPSLASLFAHLLFVEQPLHRDVALVDDVADALRSWPEAPAMIIDESDGETGSLPRALSLGYAGTSHKNCKGVLKGIANACLLEKRRRETPGHAAILSGEDLANVGPVALLQDLAVMVLLGISHVERNGHHYFRGLSMWPEKVQGAVLDRHGDLYERHSGGFPTLRIMGGQLDLTSVNTAPFGCAPMLEIGDYESL
jgi:hypothetical protein